MCASKSILTCMLSTNGESLRIPRFPFYVLASAYMRPFRQKNPTACEIRETGLSKNISKGFFLVFHFGGIAWGKQSPLKWSGLKTSQWSDFFSRGGDLPSMEVLCVKGLLLTEKVRCLRNTVTNKFCVQLDLDTIFAVKYSCIVLWAVSLFRSILSPRFHHTRAVNYSKEF